MLACQYSLLAQQYGYVQYNRASGAPFDKVTTVMQDEQGFLWIGSHNGLYRFDGIHFDNFSTQTKSQSIHQLHPREDQLLFVNDLGLYQINGLATDPQVNSLIEGTINQQADLPFYPNDFLPGAGNEVWMAQSDHSIGHYTPAGFTAYPFTKTEKSQKLALHKDKEGNLWVLSPLEGLYRFDKNKKTFDKKLELLNAKTFVIHKDQLLIGGETLQVYSLENDSPQLVKTIPLDDDQVTAIHIDLNQQFVIGTQKGKLYILEDTERPLRKIYGANEAHRVEELAFGCINEIYVTKDRTSDTEKLWICSDTGLWLLQQRFFGTVANLPLNNPIGIAIGDQGKAWVPINYLFEIAPKENGFLAQPIYNNLQANAAAYDKSGFLWVTTSTPTVALLKYKDDQLIRRYDDFKDRGEAIFNLYPDSNNNLWFCQAPVNKPIQGIGRINADGTIVYYDETKGFRSRVLAIDESSRGEIYAAGIGEEGYLYRFDPALDRFENLSPPLPFEALLNFEAHDLTIDDRGIVWLATTDGLIRYDGENISLIQNDILGQEEVRGVTHCANDNIWISSATKGLVFHHQNTSTLLGENEGLPSVISAYRCITTDKQGRLWAGTAEGLVFSRSSADNLPYSYTPRIRKLQLGEKVLPIAMEKVLRIAQNQQLEVQYTNLSFPSKSVEYEYRLLPEKEKEIMLEEQLWLPLGHKNTLRLTEIETGNYFLELRAKQPGGYQWSKPLDLQIAVFVPWYRQGWLLYATIALVVLIIGYYFRFYVRQRLKRLQQVLKYSNEKLAKKEKQLHQKIKEFKAQQTELDNANSNIQTLELFIKEIPKNASWNDIINAMGKAVNKAADINAFEIAFKEKNSIVHRGYSNQEAGGFTFRSKAFSAKTSLTCWAMVNNQEVFMNDFEKEHTLYIQEKDAYFFKSLLFIPFTLENDQPVVLCAYSIRKNDFDHNDLVMFRILAQFISFSIHEEITKKS